MPKIGENPMAKHGVSSISIVGCFKWLVRERVCKVEQAQV